MLPVRYKLRFFYIESTLEFKKVYWSAQLVIITQRVITGFLLVAQT
jgi:hypothetical protein